MRNVVARRLTVFAGRVRSVLLRVRPGEQREAETRVHLVGPAGSRVASRRVWYRRRGTAARVPARRRARDPSVRGGGTRGTRRSTRGRRRRRGPRRAATPRRGPAPRGPRRARARTTASKRARPRGSPAGAGQRHTTVESSPSPRHVPSRLRDRGLARGRPRRVSARAPVGQTPRGRSRASVVRGDLQGRARATVRAVQDSRPGAGASRGPVTPPAEGAGASAALRSPWSRSARVTTSSWHVSTSVKGV